MEVTVKGGAKEIAALVLEIQGQQIGRPKQVINVDGSNGGSTPEDRHQLADTIRSLLMAQRQGPWQDQKQQPDATEHTQTEPEEPRPQSPDQQSDKS